MHKKISDLCSMDGTSLEVGGGEHHIPFELKSSFGTNLITVGDVWFYLEI